MSEKDQQELVNKELDRLVELMMGGSREEAQSSLAKEMVRDKMIKMLSNIDPRKAEFIAGDLTLAEYLEDDFLKRLALNDLVLACSVGGWRANAIRDMFVETKKQERQGMLSRLFRRGKKDGDENADLRV